MYQMQQAGIIGGFSGKIGAGMKLSSGFKATAVSGSGTRAEQAALVKTIGARMRESRELCNMSQSVAAKRLGYSNSSKLNKIENASDTNSVPLAVISRAAKLYDVSIDYLFGACDDWESGSRMNQERELSSWMLDALEKARVRDVQILLGLHNRFDAICSFVGPLVEATRYAKSALETLRQINKSFDDMRGGARVVSSIEKLDELGTAADAKVKRFRLECKLAATDNNQLSLIP